MVFGGMLFEGGPKRYHSLGKRKMRYDLEQEFGGFSWKGLHCISFLLWPQKCWVYHFEMGGDPFIDVGWGGKSYQYPL